VKAVPPVTSVSPRLEEVVVIGLAAARVARVISCDEITAPLRDRLARAARSVDGGGHGRLVQRASDLIHCPVCTGWWASLALSAAWPGRLRLRRGLAVAGVQVMITLAERLVSEQGRAAIHEADRLDRLAG
jgi:Protein of unknown function (DUF1360)